MLTDGDAQVADNRARLEDLIRGLFSSWEEMAAAADDPLLSVAAWYLGEVQVRHYGTVWQCRPRPAQSPDEYDEPYVMAPESLSGTDGMDGEEDDGERDAEDCDVLCVPADELRALLLRDEDERLRDVLNRYLY
ncbi:hypothetical protein DWB77_07333 [Streptomyces hundungensis]|uniref:Uncharacterized protein n=2 Tax=Streptomyces hundungensis TaxID=1077946 RepID=A0A387HT31_9ACTN|nr:hypothetical protein DWB77_07333 [Streptomyces hundungensis]